MDSNHKQWTAYKNDIEPLKELRSFWRKVDKAHKLDLNEIEGLNKEQAKRFIPSATLNLQQSLKFNKPVKKVAKKKKALKPLKTSQITNENYIINKLVEIKFNKFPGWKTVKELKTNGFKWINKTQVWYGPENSLNELKLAI